MTGPLGDWRKRSPGKIGLEIRAGTGVRVFVEVGVNVGVLEGVIVDVAVAVAVGKGVSVAVGLGPGVAVKVAVGVGVSVGGMSGSRRAVSTWLMTTSTCALLSRTPPWRNPAAISFCN